MKRVRELSPQLSVKRLKRGTSIDAYVPPRHMDAMMDAFEQVQVSKKRPGDANVAPTRKRQKTAHLTSPETSFVSGPVVGTVTSSCRALVPTPETGLETSDSVIKTLRKENAVLKTALLRLSAFMKQRDDEWRGEVEKLESQVAVLTYQHMLSLDNRGSSEEVDLRQCARG